jgi:hypothetical protein
MRNLLAPVVRHAAVAAVVAIVVGGVAAASIPDSGTGVITGCYQRSTGRLRVIDAEAGDRCSRTESPITWNQSGPQGEPGPAGPSNAFYTMEREQVTLPAQGETTIATLTAPPAGSYVFSAHTTAVNPDPVDWTAVRCGIRAAGEDSYGTWGSAAAVGLAGPASWFAQAFISLPVTSAEPFDAELYCLQTRGATTAYVEESRLYGIRVGSVDVRPPTEPVS